MATSVAMVLSLTTVMAVAGIAAAPKAEAAASNCAPDAGYTGCSAFAYTGATDTFTVPANITSVRVKAWGAGGGGVDGSFSKVQAGGGGGGYVTGVAAVTPGQNLTLIVGQGGKSGINGSQSGTFGNGGQGGSHTTTGSSASDGGSGGGWSGVFNSTTLTAGTAMVIAGAGGGAGPSTFAGTPDSGGGGGGTGGQSSVPASTGRGGTATAGGAAATNSTNCTVAQSGIQFYGGSGGSVSGTTSLTPNSGGGGGGAGWYGGGGGRCGKAVTSPALTDQSGSGGGGSSMTTGPGMTAGSTTAGTNGVSGTIGSPGPAGNNADNEYVAGVGTGGSVNVSGGGNGGNGLIVFEWSLGYTIAKSTSAFSVTPGATLIYSLTITNTSANPYTAASPAGFSDNLAGVLDDATYNANAASNVAGWTFGGTTTLTGSGPLAVGQVATITYSVTVNSPDTGNNSLDNTITPSKPEGSCGASCGTSTPVITAATSCAAAASLPNGSFEAPVVNPGPGTFLSGGTSPLLWKTTASDNRVEMWADGGTDQSQNGNIPISGQAGTQWVELNANLVGALYQDVTTLPGQVLQWSVWHRARGIGSGNTTGQDVMQVQIGSTTSQSPQVPTGQSTATISDGPLAWVNYTGLYSVPAGQTTTRFQFAAISTASGNVAVGNFIDNVTLGNSPCLTATTSSTNQTTGAGGLTRPGDTLQYTVTTTNNGGAASGSSSISNAIPTGTSYVPGSLTVGGVAVTDATGDDTANVSGNTVTARIGTGASASAGGALAVGASVAVTFKVKVNATVAAGTVVAEQATVAYLWPPSVSAISSLSSTTTNPVTTTSIGLVKDVDSIVDVNGNGRVDVGDQVKYTFKVTDTGSAALTGLVVNDNKAGTVTCPTTTLAAGAVVVCTALYTATTADATAGGIVNTATASASPPSGAAAVNSAPSSVTTPMYVASLSASTTTSSSTYSTVGQNIAYTTVITNGGSSTLTGVALSGTLTSPAGPNPDSSSCTVSVPASLAPGGSFSCTVNYAARQADLDNGSVVATLTAVGSPPTGSAVTASNTITVTAVQSPSLTVTTTAAPTRVTAAGQTIKYTFAVANNGNMTISGINIADTFTAPAGPVPSITCTATTLAPGAATTCTSANYVVLQADITAGSIVNSATVKGTSATGAAVVSPVSTVPVIAAPPIVSFAPAAGEVGVAYSQQPTVAGGTGPFTWSISAGSLPAGVTLSPSTGLVSGTPTAAGNFSVTVAATDSGGVVATKTVTVVIVALPTFTFSAPAAGQVGIAYSTTFTVSGGTAPLVWSISSGALPPGLTLNTGTGVLSGTPTTSGNYSFTVGLVDANGKTTTKAVTLTITTGPLVIVKTASVATAAPGDIVTYTITLTNTSTTAFTGVALSDPLTGVLDDATYNANAAASTGAVSYASSSVSWSGPVAANGSVTITYSVTVNSPDTGNKILANTISSTTVGTNCLSGSGDTRCTATVTVSGLTIVKTADVAATTPGSIVHYTVVVTNSGQSAYTGATFTDSLSGVLDDAVYNGDSAATAGTVSYASPSLTWTGNLAVGASATITYSVTVNNPDAGNKTLNGTIVSATAGSTCPSGSPAAGCSLAVTVLTPALVIDNAIAASNLLGHWTFDEGTGATAADTGGSHPVTLSGGAGWAPGIQGSSALSTDGGSGFADAGAAVLNTSGSFSVSASVKLNSVAGVWQAIVSQDGTFHSGFYLQYRGDIQRFTFMTLASDTNDGPAAYAADSLATPTAGQWYRVTGVYNASTSTLSLYVDGVLQNTVAAPAAWAATGHLVIGRAKYGGAPGNFLNGSIDDVQVFSGVLAGGSPTTTPGAVVPLTTTISNSGQTPYTATSVTLSLPAAADDAVYDNDATASSGTVVYNAAAGTLVWTGNLAIGAVVTVTATMTVRNPDPGDKALTTVVASSAAGSTCPPGSSTTICTATVQVRVPALTIVKSADVTSTTPGSVVHYTVIVTNTGQTDYSGATFTDPLSGVLDDATYRSDAAATSGTVSFSTPTISWTGNLLVGATATITYSVTVNQPDTGNKSLTSTIVSTTPGSTCPSGGSDPRCSNSVTVLIPALTLTSSVDATTTTPGSVVHYTFGLNNTGQTPYTATAVTFDLTGVLDDASYNSDAATTAGSLVINANGTATWTVSLAAGATANATLSVTVNSPPAGDKSLRTTVISDATGSTCPTGSANTACKTAVTVLIPGLTITKTANVSSVVTGGVVAYTVLVTNTGQSAYAAATFTDSLAAVLTDAVYAGGASATVGTVSYAAPTLSWTGALAVGASATITYSVTVNNPDTGAKRMTNTVVSTTAGNNCVSGSTDTRCTAVVNVLVPGLTIVKTANTSSTAPGSVVGYTVTVTNSGQTAYTGAAFTDSLAGVLDDAGYNTNAAATAGTVSYAGSTVSWSGNLAVGAVATITYSVTVNTAPGGNNLLTDVAVSATAGTNCLSGSADTRCTVTVPVARLVIVHTGQATTTPGSIVHFSATFTNTGQVPYTGISIDSPGADLLDDVVASGNQTATSGSLSVTPAALVWTGSIPIGGVVTVSADVTVLNPDTGNKSIVTGWESAAPGNNCPTLTADVRCSSTTAVLIPGLTISTTANTTAVVPGGVVGYTVVVRNSGQTAYAGAAFADSLTNLLDDATYNADAAATTGSVSFTSPTLSWTGNLAVGATATITFSVTARSPDPGDKIMSNTVSSTTVGNTCPPASGNAACVTTVSVLTPALTIVKTANTSTATLGSTVRFTVVVTNSGQTPYTGATYTDNLSGVLDDAGYNVDATATSGSINIVAPSVVWTGDLAVGASATITYTDTVNNPDTGDRSLTGTIVSSTTGSNCASGTTDSRCSAVVAVTNSVSLTFTKTANVATSVAGAVVRYTVTVTNASSGSISSVNFTDPLAGILDDANYNADATASSGTVSYTNPNLTWSGTIAAGATVTVAYSVTVHTTITGNELLTGTVSSTSTPGSNTCAAGSSDTRCSNTVPIAALLIQQSAAESTTTPGGVVHLSEVFTNTGQVAYQGISVIYIRADALDDAVANGDQVASSGTLTFDPTFVTWTGDIPVGGVVTITRSITVLNPDPGNQRITATLTSTATGNNCPSGGTDPRCTYLTTVLTPGLTFTNTASVSSVAPGGTVTYTIAVKNTGQTVYTGAAFTDSLTGLLDDASYNADATATSGSVSYSASTLSWTGNLAVGATATITFTATAKNPDPGDKAMSNTVVSSTVGSTCLPASGAAGCSASAVVLTPGLTIVKTASPATVTLGSTVTYTVVVTNSGQTSYPAATFSDNLAGVLDDSGYNTGATATSGAVAFSSPTLTWTGAMAPGAAATITYTVTVNNPDNGDRSMADTLVSSSTGSNCAAGSTDTRCASLVAVTNQPTLRLTKTSDVATSVGGGVVHYTIVALNSSTGAVAANFTDPLAGILDDADYNADAVASVGTVTFASPNLSWSGTIPAGATVTVTYSVTVHAAITGNQILSGTLSSTSVPGSNNCAAGSVDIRCSSTVPVARLDLIQTATESSATPGSIVHVTAVYTNTGQVAYSGITVTSPRADTSDDTIPTGDQVATSGTVVRTATSLIWTGDIPVGGSVTITRTLTVQNPDPGNQRITATLTSTAVGNNCPAGTTDPRCTFLITVVTPGLTITTTASTPATVPGGTVGYTVTVHNTGQTAYTGASFTDPLDGLLNDANYNADASATLGAVSYSAPTLTWTGNLAIGATATITFSVTVKNPDTGDKTMANAVTSSTVGSTCPPASSNTACRTTVLVLTPALTILKTANLATTTLGSTVSYTVLVTNSGQTSYPAATFTDDLAAVLDDANYNADAVASSGTLGYSAGVLTWTGALAVGAAATITYTVTVKNPDTADRSMTNTVVSTSAGSNCVSGSADPRCTVVVAVVNAVTLTFTKSADVVSTVAGGVVHYTVTARNSSASAITGANFTDPLAGIIDDATYNGDVVATTGTPVYTNPNLTWSGTVAAGGTVTVTYSVTVHATVTGNQILTGTLTSTSSPGSDNCLSGSTDNRCLSTVPVAALVIAQSYTEATTTPGSVVHLSATFTNTGQFPYTGISISSPSADTVDDAIPAGDQSATSGTLVLTAAGIIWTGNIPVGGSVTVVGTLTVQNPDPGNKILTGTLVSTAPGNNCPSGGTDPRCTATSTVLLPGLTITKSASTPSTTPGSSVGYTISIHNTGQTAYSGATVTDSLAGVLDDAAYNADAATTGGTLTYNAPTLTWTGALAVGATVTVTYSVTVKNPDPGDKSLVDAAVSSDVGSTCPAATGTAACRTSVDVLTPGLTIVKTANLATATLGASVSYSISVTNTGQTAYVGATLADSLAGVLDDAAYNGDAAATSGSTGYTGGVLTWTGDLAVGAAAIITYSVTVTIPSTGDRSMVNTVTSTTTGNNCATGSTDTRCAATVVVNNARTVRFVKTADVTTTAAGAVVRYTVTANNNSTGALSSVTFTDGLAGVLDDAGYNGDAVATSGAVTFTSPNLTWTGPIAAGAMVTVTYSVTVHATITGNELLTGTVTSASVPASDNCLVGSTDVRCTSTVPVAALVIVQTFATPTTTPGSVIQLGATFTNTGQVPYFGITIAAAPGFDDLGDDATPNGDQSASSGIVSFGVTGPTWTGDIPVGGVVTVGGTATINNPDTGNRALRTTLASTAVGNNCQPGSTDTRCTATATVLIPGLTITNRADTSTVVTGGIVHFTVVVNNSGQTPYTGAGFTDPLAGLLDDATYNADAAASSGAVSFSAGTLSWAGDLAVGATATITFSATARNPDPGDKAMSTTVVSVAAGSTCPAASGNAACSSTVVVLTPALTIVKTASVSSATLGSTVRFTVVVTNSGQTPYTGATYTDNLGGILDDANYNNDATVTTGSISIVPPSLVWTGDLAVGATATISYTDTVSNPDTGDRSLTGTIVSATTGSNCATGSLDTRCSAVVLITNAVSVTFSKTSDVATSSAGGVVHFRITATNASTSPISSVNFTDPLAGILDDAAYNADAVASIGTVAYTNPNLTWTGTIPAGATVIVTYSVTVFAVGTGDEQLTGRLTSTAPTTSNNCLASSIDSRCSTTVPLARLELAYSRSIASTITPGGVVHFVSTYTNTGKVPYFGISVTTDATDAADDGLPGVQTVSSGTLVLGATGVTWTGDIPVGGVVTLDALMPVKNPDTGDKFIKAMIGSTAPGNNCAAGTTDPDCTVVITVLVPGLTITKTANTPVITPGGTVGYTITVQNTGQTPYTGATVTDPLAGVLDDALYNSDATATSGAVSLAGSTLTWTGNLAVGATATIVYSVTVRTPDPGDKAMADTVSSSDVGSTCLPGAGGPGCSTTVVVLTPALTFTATADTASTVAGATLNYTVVIVNTGQTSYPAASFTDSLVGVVDDATYNAGATTATSGTVGYAGGVLSWTGALDPGDSATVTFTVTVGNPDTGNHRLDQSIVSSNTGSTCPLGGTDPRCSTSVPVASLHLVNTVDVTTTKPTSVVRYSATFTNTGQVGYVGISVADSLVGTVDDATYNGDATATAGSVIIVIGSGRVVWTGDLAVGASVTVTGSVTVNNPDLGDKHLSTLLTTSAPSTNCPVGGTDPACTTNVDVLTPGLTMSQVANTSTTTPGSTVGYTITIANTGQTAYTAATVTNRLEGVLADATYSGNAVATAGAVTYAAPVLTWTGDLAIGQAVVISYTVTVDNPDLGDKTLISTLVSSELGSSCPAGSSNAACSATVTVLIPALAIAVTADSSTTTPGSVVGYTVTIGNVGQTAYLGASVTTALGGVLDDGVYAGDGTATIGSVTFGSPNLTWTGDLPVGATAIVTYHVTVANPDVGNHSLVTSVSSAAAGGTCTAAAPCVNTVTVLTPGLSLSTSANVATATPGDPVVFTITITNTGQTPYVGTTVTTSLAAVVDDATFDGTASASLGVVTYAAPTLSWTGSLPVGASAVITYGVTVRQPDVANKVLTTTVVSSAVGSTCPSGSPNPACTARVSVLVPALTITKTAGGASTTPGSVVNYTISILNTGQAGYANAVVSDSLVGVLTDAGYNGDAAVVGGGSLTYVNSVLTWSGGLLVGARATITYTITVNSPDAGDKQITNQVFSSAPGSNCPPGGTVPACSALVQVLVPALAITQTADQATIVAGSAVTYTVTLANVGQTPYTAATFTDSLSRVLDDAAYPGNATASTGTVSYSSGTLAWTGALAIGATATVRYSVTANYPAAGDHLLQNSVRSTSPGSTCVSGLEIGCSTSITVLIPALSILKTADTAQVVAGGRLLYSIIATNTGQADYPSVTLTDPLAAVLANSVYSGDATATTGVLDYSASTLSWTGGLARGTSVLITYSITVNVAVADGTNLINRAISSAVGSNCLSTSADPACVTSTGIAARTISLTAQASSFTLTGPPRSTVSQEGAVILDVTTNSTGGYMVAVVPESPLLIAQTPGNPATIPVTALSVRETGSSLYQGLLTGAARIVHQRNQPSSPNGDAISNDYQVNIPYVPADTYVGTLDYIATAQ